MPFKSEAQRKWMWANKPKMAKGWEKHTPDNADLPEHVKKAMIQCFTKIAIRLKKLKPVPMAVIQQQEALQAAAEKTKGLSPIAARVAESARVS